MSRECALDLNQRMAALGGTLAERETAHRDALSRARAELETLRARVEAALESFHGATESAPWLRIELGDLKVDDKHLHAFEFDVRRGRHRAIIVAKSRGDLTFVGPFHVGKTEGPCRSHSFDETAAIERTLGDLLERFVEEAAAP